jgi:hypothetical protein
MMIERILKRLELLPWSRFYPDWARMRVRRARLRLVRRRKRRTR